jgi:hypothetical protein
MIVEIFTFSTNVFFYSALLFVGAISMKESPEEADNSGVDLLKLF